MTFALPTPGPSNVGWVIARLPDTRRRNITSTTPSRSKDMTEYTDEELAQAIHAAAHDRMDSIDINHDTGQSPHQIHPTVLYDLREILEHLPKPQDDWQECSWGDISHTDERVKAEYISGTVIECTPDGISDDGIYIVDGNFIPFSTDVRWYRIPALVVHPDPEEHEVIFVFKTEARDYMISGGRQLVIWDGCSYVNSEFISKPDHIIDWSPAKVVADND